MWADAIDADRGHRDGAALAQITVARRVLASYPRLGPGCSCAASARTRRPEWCVGESAGLMTHKVLAHHMMGEAEARDTHALVTHHCPNAVLGPSRSEIRRSHLDLVVSLVAPAAPCGCSMGSNLKAPGTP